jgi:hypothetical protein
LYFVSVCEKSYKENRVQGWRRTLFKTPQFSSCKETFELQTMVDGTFGWRQNSFFHISFNGSMLVSGLLVAVAVQS